MKFKEGEFRASRCMLLWGRRTLYRALLQRLPKAPRVLRKTHFLLIFGFGATPGTPGPYLFPALLQAVPEGVCSAGWG